MDRTGGATTAFLRSHPRLADTGAIAAITVFTGLLSGSEQWAGLDTPDSSFYNTLALHGDEVTDRAPETSYYWTRLGYIVPVRILTTVLGTYPGFAAYRMLLLLMVVAGIYLALRAFTGIPAAAAFTTLASLSTVVLAYLANTYLTGSVLAGLAVLIAFGVRGSGPNLHWPWALAAGATMGWLVMVNPYGALLGGFIWFVLACRPLHWRMILGRLVVAGATAAVVFGAYLLAGRIVFPKMDWLGTYLEWNAKMDYKAFASREPVWLGDISLLVIAATIVVVAVVVGVHRRERAAQTAGLIIAAMIVLVAGFYPFMGGITLEAPMYQAMLWVPSLTALTLLGARVTADRAWTWRATVAAIVGIALVIAAGHWPGILPFGVGVVLALVMAAITIAGLIQQRPVVVVVIVMALFLGGAQLLQNSRRDIGLYYLSPYSNAFRPNPVDTKVRIAVDTEDWLLANTTRDDQILLWVGSDWVGGDRELFVVAGMQLWGENRVTLEPELTADDIARLEAIRPSVLALYAPTMDGIYRFWQSIPGALDPTAPECYDFDWPDDQVTTGHACLTRLRWPA